jgi:hypothetical protein
VPVDGRDQVLRRGLLGVDVDSDPAFLGDIQSLVEGRHFKIGKLPGESRAQIQRADLLKGHVGDPALAVGHAIDGWVVHQHQLSIAGGSDVQFYEIHAGVNRGLNRRQRIFRMVMMLAAMGAGQYDLVFIRGGWQSAQGRQRGGDGHTQRARQQTHSRILRHEPLRHYDSCKVCAVSWNGHHTVTPRD